MVGEDLKAFGSMLDAVCALLSRGNHQPNEVSTAIFFRALADWSLDEVRAAFDAHVRDPERGRFVPTPADILAKLQGARADDDRPGPEEAWAIAVRGIDETATVVWTAEIAEAWGIALPVMRAGDEVGARMAFKESYLRLVSAAREARQPAAWTPTLGTDLAHRTAAIREAVAAGRLPPSAHDVLDALPAPRGPAVLLENATTARGIPPGVAERMRELRNGLASRQTLASLDPGIARTAELRKDSAAKVAAYRHRGGGEGGCDG